jgi:hypothetical protein
MQAIRQVKDVSGKKIIIDLPDRFYAKKVEIIVMPYIKTSPVDRTGDWKDDFLSVSQWKISEDEIRMKSWPLQAF